MDYVVIRGVFHVVGFSPDGDSVAFMASKRSLWGRLDGAGPITGAAGANLGALGKTLTNNADCAQLRLLGIDAPETHYKPEGAATPVGEFRQPGDFGARAAAGLLAALGVTNLVWRKVFNGQYLASATVTPPGNPGAAATVHKKLTDAIPGYIVTREVEKEGRPLSWAFAGDPGVDDGATMTPEALAARLPNSINHRMLAKGMAYPYFFTSGEAVLRQSLAAAVDAAVGAAAKDHNLWEVDRTMQGVVLRDISAIVHREGVAQDGALIWPYLFRKALKAWCKTGGSATKTSMDLSQLFVTGNPTVVVDDKSVRLDSIVSTDGGTLRLTKPPQHIVFPP